MNIIIDTKSAIDKLANVRCLVKDEKPTDFWRQCVRDVDGRWDKYTEIRSMEGTQYFHGCQPSVDYANLREAKLLRTNIAIRQEVYDTLENVVFMEIEDFQKWLESLHYRMRYRPVEDWKNAVHATTTHTDVVMQDVLPIVQQYNDPYGTNSNGPIFDGFPNDALPIDEVDGDFVKHTYPPLQFSDYYFNAALRQIKDLLKTVHNEESYIYGVANLYQLLINLHYFPSINTSLYMNIANGLLEIASIQGIEHGIKDFVAMRLQPENFQVYFYHEVLRHRDA